MQGKKGSLICIEGIDGCGKTTHAHLLVKNLQKNGYDAVYTTEPTRGKIGTFIRNHFLEGEKRYSSIIEALLFAADRVEHGEKVIKPALKQGKIVVSDRYVYSSLAYQGAVGLDLHWIWMLNKWIVQPDLAILIDAQPEKALRRIKRKKSVMETLETQRKVREVYLKFLEEGKLVKVNGDRPIGEVSQEILNVVLSHLRNR